MLLGSMPFAVAQDSGVESAPDRTRDESPYDWLILRVAPMINRSGPMERVGGVQYTIEDGIVYGGKQSSS